MSNIARWRSTRIRLSKSCRTDCGCGQEHPFKSCSRTPPSPGPEGKPESYRSLCVLRRVAFNERTQNRIQHNAAFSRLSLSAFELDPPLIEAIEHLDAGHRILHALRPEHRFPSVACY